ncbi:MAG: hypothetical protein HN577_12505, partial [Rhodospirillaceae bacterium]|nr:hypothetical protein [Rhodospirillaceae bacterium]
MSLVVCIETAAPAPVFVMGDDDKVLFADAPSGRIEGPIYLRDKVLEALGANGRDRSEIDYLAVDLGPGGLTATRSGVTFANALAYGLGKPLMMFYSLAIFLMVANSPLNICTAEKIPLYVGDMIMMGFLMCRFMLLCLYTHAVFYHPLTRVQFSLHIGIQCFSILMCIIALCLRNDNGVDAGAAWVPFVLVVLI